MIIIDIPTPVMVPIFNPSIVGNDLEKILLSIFRYQIVGIINIQNLHNMNKIWEWISFSKILIPNITEIEGTNATKRIAIKGLLWTLIYTRHTTCKKNFPLH